MKASFLLWKIREGKPLYNFFVISIRVSLWKLARSTPVIRLLIKVIRFVYKSQVYIPKEVLKRQSFSSDMIVSSGYSIRAQLTARQALSSAVLIHSTATPIIYYCLHCSSTFKNQFILFSLKVTPTRHHLPHKWVPIIANCMRKSQTRTHKT